MPALDPVTPERSTERSELSAGDILPGRVIEVHHPLAVSRENEIHTPTVGTMVDRGMAELTGYEPGDARSA